ncbi:MAG: hypothetical protein P4L84_01250 [Isosphaeraceae bacterium]|nr:hypothetical protein [Isosphaeraceae bacterium]
MDAERESNPIRSSSLPEGQEDRRGGSRYNVVEDQSWLGWWDGPSFVTTPSRILDLSLRGALLHVEALPGPGKAVWFCPPTAATPDWLEATVVQSRNTPHGPAEARIAFRRLLPYETFQSLVYGNDRLGPPDVETHWAAAEFEPDDC